MKIHFETYGPFSLKRKFNDAILPDDIQDFWDEIEDSQDGLGSAIGVYIISTRSGQASKPKPWYVGKTDSGFRHRLIQHARDLSLFRSLNSHSPKGSLEVLFIARKASDGKKFKSPRTPRKGGSKKVKHGSIDFLETLLIGACLAQNENLLNAQKMSKYRDIVVPGLMNEKKGKPTRSALFLRNLLD